MEGTSQSVSTISSPELYHVNGADLSAVAADAVGEPLQPYQHTVGNTLVPPEKLLRGHGLGEMHGEPEFSQRNHVLRIKSENRGKIGVVEFVR